VLLAVGILLVLAQFGIDTSKLALVAGALGVGIGFGLQTIFNNFIAGLLLLFEKSLRIGDFIELESGLTGEVREINIRSTLIRTNDNVEVLVPNAEFVSGRVINWTLRDPEKRMHVPFGVAYGSDKDKVREAALEAATAVDATELHRDDRQPQVWLVEFGDSSLNFELVVWLKPEAVKRPRAVLARYNWEIESALARHGLEIPFPQRDLHLRSVFQAKPEDPEAALKRLTEPPPSSS
ncbi:MAG: mechanosensitive ion channel domain-containing protein, partial [Pseudomonadota bacterium]